MRRIKIYLVAVVVMALMASTTYAAPKDYATMSWVTSLLNKESPEYYGTVRITITGVVGTKTSSGLVELAQVPDAYYYTGDWNGPFVGGYSDYETMGDTVFDVYPNQDMNNTEKVAAAKGQFAQVIQNYAKTYDYEKVDVKLIPVVEGATMKIELVNSPYLAYYQFHYPAFSGTSPLLLTEVVRRKSFLMEMWTGDAPQTGTFKKIVDEDGTFRVYEFPVDHPDYTRGPIYAGEEAGAKAFYVVTEAEAKALLKKTPASTVPGITAVPTAAKVLVDGENVSFDAYSIAGNNYFKLRDLAYVLNGSDKQFSVDWDGANNAIALQKSSSYTAVGGEMATKGTASIAATPSSAKILLGGKAVTMTAYTIRGNNYFKLRDVGIAFDFDVSWNNAVQTIEIDTASSYTAD